MHYYLHFTHGTLQPKLCTTVFAPNVIQQFESQIPPIAGNLQNTSSLAWDRINFCIGFSLRLLSSHAHYTWMESHLTILNSTQKLIVGALAVVSLLSLFFSSAFTSVFLFYLFMGAYPQYFICTYVI